MTTDENGQRIPWLAYGVFLTGLMVQLVGIVIWGTQLGSRVSVLEMRGSPEAVHELSLLRDRIILVEERQNVVIKSLQLNADKLDMVDKRLDQLIGLLTKKQASELPPK